MAINLRNLSKKPDYFFLILVIILSFVGIIMISSGSVVISYETYNNNYHFVIQQLISFIVGIAALLAAMQIDYRFWKKNSFWILVITLLLLVLVFIPGIGKSAGGAHRWIGLGAKWFQPSELVKLTFLIYLASWLDQKGETVKSFWGGFLPFSFLILLIGFLIMKQPDMGTMSIILISATMVYFASGAKMSHLGIGLASITVLGAILIKAAPYRLQRLLVFLNPTADTQGAAYHINQALMAIGSGGWWGLGFGQSKQKYLYLPQVHTDSIFALIVEELGFVRAGLIIVGFLLLGIRGLQIAKKAPDNFSRLLVVGIISWILIQAFINIGAMLNLLPLTGVPMPFISFGGSSLIITMAAVGIILNISKETGESV